MEIGSTAWYVVMLLAGVAVGGVIAMVRVVLDRRDGDGGRRGKR